MNVETEYEPEQSNQVWVKRTVPLFDRVRAFRRYLIELYGQKSLYKILIAVNLILVCIGSLFYTEDLVEKLEEREMQQMRLYAVVLRNAVGSTVNEDLSMVLDHIKQANDLYQIPTIFVNEFDEPEVWRNVDLPSGISEERKIDMLQENLVQMKLEHSGIPVELGGGRTGYIYYSNSFLLTQLRFYPYVQLTIIFVIGFLAYVAFSSSRRAEQNRVWVGLAKETAHQLGTPISSLMAWIEYFKSSGDVDSSVTDEMEKDVERLEMITYRFSHIGSVPVISEEEVARVVVDYMSYLEKRISTKVGITVVNKLEPGQKARINKNLFEWVVENISKNAVDAMSGVGQLTLTLYYSKKGKDEVMLDIADTGKGIAKGNIQKVFTPGFSTKKRGWGLGLTLAKRIIEEYHGGKLFVKASEPGKGTVFSLQIQGVASEPLLS